jgi:hypothetical protein
LSQGLAGEGARYFREDFDGAFHVDIFEYSENSPETYWGAVGGGDGEIPTNAFRDSLNVFIDRIFASPPPAIAAEKYAWLARYFFEKCQCHLWHLPLNLPISEEKRRAYEEELRDIQLADEHE